MEIRHARPEDLPAILSIYERARTFMAATGNPRQWAANGWPPETLIREDIRRGKSYVCTADDGSVAVVFYFDMGADIEPTYRIIEEGAWLDPSPYGVVHRIASSGTVPGTGRFCLDWAYAQAKHLRIDTHPDNQVMQRLLERCGFRRTGIIHVVEDNDPRLAYEKTGVPL